MDPVIILLIITLVFAVLAVLMSVLNLYASREQMRHIEQNNRVTTDAAIELQRGMAEQQDQRLRALEDSFSRLRMENEDSFSKLRRENNEQIALIRETVEDKLQNALDAKISESFQLVNDRLEQVYKGLGEMQTVAANVGDLNRMLSNVKTRGILGEVQLGAILEQILSPEQYVENVVTKEGSTDRVEYAIELPGDEAGPVYLPIDAKFPGDTYNALLDAYDSGDRERIRECSKRLAQTIAGEARMIRDKYIDPPNTTDFAIMFLPFEGLYAEVVRANMLEVLQRKYKVTIAGPTTMAALLNSLQMGFNTLAIEKRSSEVWQLLAAVKTEFDTFAGVLDTTQRRISQANEELDKLVGVRTRKIQKKLSAIERLNAEDAGLLIELD
ncbi:MAG: DNA recombination protein RmuC [Mogibacterium sp.]|nr:DNA recombination protein RmuC [Mogibacterium sp.]